MTRFLRLAAVKDQTGLSRSSIYQKIADGSFPRSIPLGTRAVGWLEEEINQWINDRIKLARAHGEHHG